MNTIAAHATQSSPASRANFRRVSESGNEKETLLTPILTLLVSAFPRFTSLSRAARNFLRRMTSIVIGWRMVLAVAAAIGIWAAAPDAHGAIAVGKTVVVQSTAGVTNVRAGAGSATISGTQSNGVTGTVTGGPTVAPIAGSGSSTTYTWWNVNFLSGADGWVSGANLIEVVASNPTAVWTTQPPANITAGQSFQVAWTTSGSPDHVNVHWNPTDPTAATAGFGNTDTTDSSTSGTSTSSPSTLTAPTKNADGSAITGPTVVKYVVHVKNTASGLLGNSAVVSVTVSPAVTAPTAPTAAWTTQPPANITAGQSFQVAWTTTGNPSHVNIHWNPTDPLAANAGYGQTDTIDSSANSPTSSPVTLIAPSKNANGTPITAPTTVKYVVHVTNATGSGSSTIVPVTVTVAPTPAAPSISSVTPSPLIADAGNAFQTVTLNGANFVSKPTVTLTWTGQPGYTVPSSQVTFVSASRVDLSIQLGAVADYRSVRVQNPDAQLSNIKQFTVSAPSGTGPDAFTLSNEAPYTSSTGPAVRLNWTVAGSAPIYDVYRNGILYYPGLTGQTFLNIANLTAGQTYSYFIRARNAAGYRDSNNIQVIMPQPSTAAPGVFTLSNDTPVWDLRSPPGPAVQLHWTQSDAAATYEVYRDGAKIYPLAGDFTTLAFRNEAGLNPGQTYAFHILARNAIGSRASNTIRLTMPTAPVDAPGSFTLSNETPFWDAVPNRPAVRLNWIQSLHAAAYEVFRDGIKIFPAKGTYNGTTFLDNAAAPNATVRYKVRASNTLGSIESNEIQVVLPSQPPPPDGLPGAFSVSANNAFWDTITNSPAVPLFWSAAEKAESYEILRDNALIHQAGTALERVDTINLIPGRTYSYQIRARNARGVSVSNSVSVPVPLRPAAPLPTFTLRNDPPYLLRRANQAPAVRLIWDSVVGATSYDLFQDDLRVAVGLRSTSFERLAGLGHGATYAFYVIATGPGGTVESNRITVVMPAPTISAPDVFSLTSGTPTWDERPPAGPVVSLRWTAARNAASYTLLRDGMVYASGLGGTTFLNDKNLTPGGTHRFQVVAVNASGSTLSNEISLVMPDGPPVGTKPLPLTPGVPSSNLSGRAGDKHLFAFTVPAGMAFLRVTTTGQAGNVDLYLSVGGAPKPPNIYGYSSINLGSVEQVDVTGPAAGTYYAMLVGVSDYGNASIRVTLTPGGTAVATPVITPGSMTTLEPITLGISCATTGGEIRYTTDGSEPKETSPLFDASNPPTFSAEKITIKARAFKVGLAASAIATASYSMPLRFDAEMAKSFEPHEISGWLGQDRLFYLDVPKDEIQPSVVRGVAAVGIKLGSDGASVALGSLEILARKDRVPTPTEFDLPLYARGEAIIGIDKMPTGLGGRWFFLVRNRSVRADFFTLRLFYNPVSATALVEQEIQTNRPTWLVSHGRRDHSSSFGTLGVELANAEPTSQILLVNWGALGVNYLRLGDPWTVIYLNGGDTDLSGTMFIQPAARKLRQLMALKGVDPSRISWLGHSWGSMLGYEFATLPWQGRLGTFNKMVALDPAESGPRILTGDVYPNHDTLKFSAAVTGRSMALVGYGLFAGAFGSGKKAVTAHDSCVVRFDNASPLDALAVHGGVVQVYERALRDWHDPNYAKRNYAWYLSPSRMTESAKSWRQDSVNPEGLLRYTVLGGIIVRRLDLVSTPYELAIHASLDTSSPKNLQDIERILFCDPSTYPQEIRNP